MVQPTRRHVLGWLGRVGLASFWAAELAEGTAWATAGPTAGVPGRTADDRVPTGPRAPKETRGGVLSLHLQAPDLEAQQRFYATTMGFSTSLDSGVLRVQAGGTALVFEQAPPGTRPIYHVAWAIPENQFQAAKAWLGHRTPLLRRSNGQDAFHFESANRHAVYFADPAGNILELIARHNLRDARPGPFTVSSILYVNHFALVVDAMEAAVAAVKTGLDLEIQGTPAPNFTKLGDEHRHLVLVTRGRLWLPEFTVAAGVFETAAVLAGAPRREMKLEPHPYRIAVGGEG